MSEWWDAVRIMFRAAIWWSLELSLLSTEAFICTISVHLPGKVGHWRVRDEVRL